MTQIKFPLDRDLCHLIEGDARAFRDFYDLWKDRVFIWCKRFIKDQHDREDVMSEVFVKIWQNIPHILNAEAPKAYIHRIVTFSCIRFLKKGRDGKTWSVEDLEAFVYDLQAYRDDVVEAEVYKELRKLMYQAIEGLPEQRKKVVLLLAQENLTPSEVSSMLNISRSTVYNHWAEATRVLRNLLKDKRLHFVMVLIAGVTLFFLKKYAL